MKKLVKKLVNKVVSQSKRNKIARFLGAETVTKLTQNKEYIINQENGGLFKDKVVVVTGGTGAIGETLCIRFAIEGAKVYVGGRNKVKLNSIVSHINDLGYIANELPVDVTDEKSVEKAFGVIEENEDGKIDVLVNCAGGGSRDKATLFADQQVDVIDTVLDSNLRGSMLCSREAAKRMMPRKAGKIVNISSAVGVRGMKKYTEYAAAKAGIIGYTASLALELAEYDINVNCVSPGYIPREINTLDEENMFKNKCPMKKIGTVDDVAEMVLFIASDKAGFITGQNIMVDGGRTLGLYSEG